MEQVRIVNALSSEIRNQMMNKNLVASRLEIFELSSRTTLTMNLCFLQLYDKYLIIKKISVVKKS